MLLRLFLHYYFDFAFACWLSLDLFSSPFSLISFVIFFLFHYFLIAIILSRNIISLLCAMKPMVTMFPLFSFHYFRYYFFFIFAASMWWGSLSDGGEIIWHFDYFIFFLRHYFLIISYFRRWSPSFRYFRWLSHYWLLIISKIIFGRHYFSFLRRLRIISIDCRGLSSVIIFVAWWNILFRLFHFSFFDDFLRCFSFSFHISSQVLDGFHWLFSFSSLMLIFSSCMIIL